MAKQQCSKGFLFIHEASKATHDECIPWPFAVSKSGYGQIKFRGTKMNAHRAALILSTGKDCKKLQAAHSCRDKTCVNPNHSRWATNIQNSADRYRDGTQQLGSDVHNSRLTDDQVLKIYDDYRSPTVIAKEYGVSRGTICCIKRGRNWAWLTQANERQPRGTLP